MVDSDKMIILQLFFIVSEKGFYFYYYFIFHMEHNWKNFQGKLIFITIC